MANLLTVRMWGDEEMIELIADLFMNFSILFTLTILLFFFAQEERFLMFPQLKRYQPISMGLIASFVGIILMIQNIHAMTNVIIDARYAAILFSGMFGGPIAVLIATTIISAFRYMFFDMTLEASVAALNTLVYGYVIAVFLFKYPMTMKNALLFYLYGVFQTSVVIFWYHFGKPGALQDLFLFITFSLLSYFIVWISLKKMNQLSNEVEKIEELAETDYLTGLSNNRKYQEIFYDWRNSREGFHVAVIDIDHFKRVNDTYGHPIGDLVLKELAKRMTYEANQIGAKVSRIGGEEFGALLPATNRKEAQEQAERIRSIIASSPFVLEDGLELKITVSIGVAQYPGDGQSMPDLYKLADEKLYDAKLNGRNRVCVTAEPTIETNQVKREVF